MKKVETQNIKMRRRELIRIKTMKIMEAIAMTTARMRMMRIADL